VGLCLRGSVCGVLFWGFVLGFCLGVLFAGLCLRGSVCRTLFVGYHFSWSYQGIYISSFFFSQCYSFASSLKKSFHPDLNSFASTCNISFDNSHKISSNSIAQIPFPC
jgi:hypothetical protein